MEAEGQKSEAQGISKHGRAKHRRASRNQSDGGSPSHLVKHSRINKKLVSMYAAQPTMVGCCMPRAKCRLFGYVNTKHLKYAETALQFYGNNQGAEFEIVRVLHYSASDLIPPDPDVESTFWIHVSFTAKSKNVNSSNASPKHFFGEIFRDDLSGELHVKFCDTFEPSDDPGFDHGCSFCSIGQKFHPAHGYTAGRPPWRMQSLGGAIWKDSKDYFPN